MSSSIRGPHAIMAAFLLSLLFTHANAAVSVSQKGCYSAAPNLNFYDTNAFQSSGHCGPACYSIGKAVYGTTNAGECYCGDQLPPTSDVAQNSVCTSPCQGFPSESCGSTSGAFNIGLTGISANPGVYADSNAGGSSSSVVVSSVVPVVSTVQPSTQVVTAQPSTQTQQALTTTLPVSVVTIHGSTIIQSIPATTFISPTNVAQNPATSPTVVTQPDTSNNNGGGGGSNTVGIAVGVVVGVVAAIAIVVAAVFYFKRRRSAAAADHHRRTTSVNPFGQAGQPPAYSMSDSRLDQNMVERRQSNGSIFADNEDYSRRILKVTNPS